MSLALIPWSPLKGIDLITLGILSLVLCGLIAWHLARVQRKVDAFGEELAGELGWKPGPYRRRRFTVLPEERVLREWKGRRVGLSVIGAVKGNPGFLRMTLACGLPESFRIKRRTDLLGRAKEGFEVKGASALGESLLANPAVLRALEKSLRYPLDKLSLAKGSLKVELALGLRFPLADRAKVRALAHKGWTLLLLSAQALPESSAPSAQRPIHRAPGGGHETSA